MKKIVMLMLMVVIVAGCSAKPIGGDTGEDSVFDDTIDDVGGNGNGSQPSAVINRMALDGGQLHIQVIEEDGKLKNYKAQYEGDLQVQLDKSMVVDSFPMMTEVGERLENTSGLFKINGYLEGAYYAKRLSDTKSTIVFMESGDSGHLDLMEVDHQAGESLTFVWLKDDFTQIYYEVTSADQHLIGSYLHDLDSNVTITAATDGTVSALDQVGVLHIFNSGIYDDTVTLQESLDTKPALVSVPDETVYDKVIANGIVTDPDTGTYKFGYDLGIIGNKIAAISNSTLKGNEIIDASGLIVAPGFIDMLGFNLSQTVSKYKITDGVTTNLSLHGCSVNFDEFFRTYEKNSPQFINFGGAVFAIRLRIEVGLDYYGAPTQAQIDEMARRTREEIEAGAVAVAFSPEYYPGTSPEEIKAIMAVAAEYDIPTHFHARYSSIVGEDIGIKGVEEVIGYARELDARVQFMHLHSTGGTGMMDEALEMINDARAEGVKVSFDIYPYDSWASRMSMQRFRSGWQERYGIDYGDLQIAGTGVWVTEENFATYKAQGALAIAYAMDEDEMLLALSEEYAQVGSDGNIMSETEANNHFRGAGTFSRILGKYVRDEDAFSLMDGLEKMTINSARHLESVSKDMAMRGRLQVGMIADITVFDYKTVLDMSTPTEPATESVGIEYVFVNGEIGLRDGVLDRSVKAGQAIKSDFLIE